MIAWLGLNEDNQLVRDDLSDDPMDDLCSNDELLEWLSLIEAELFARGLRGMTHEHADGSITVDAPRRKR